MMQTVATMCVMHCRTLDEAIAEVRRRKRAARDGDVVVSFEESPYGGYLVYNRSADDVVDALVDPIVPDIVSARQKRVYL